jgi:dCTP deaminase
MILANTELHAALDEKRLIIIPEPTPRFPSVGGEHCPYDTHSVDLTLSDTIEVPFTSNITIDLMQTGKITDTIRRNAKTFKISEETPFRLMPNTFVLGNTKEWVEIPIQEAADRSLAARIEGKSSRARFGILVHFTAPTVHPGFKGTLTLEMINLSPFPFLLTPGMAIAQLIVEEVRGVPKRNDSQFQGQDTPAGVGTT